MRKLKIKLVPHAAHLLAMLFMNAAKLLLNIHALHLHESRRILGRIWLSVI